MHPKRRLRFWTCRAPARRRSWTGGEGGGEGSLEGDGGLEGVEDSLSPQAGLSARRRAAEDAAQGLCQKLA